MLLFLGILGGILLAPDGGVVGDASQPLVDVATEDQALVALQVYEAESIALEELAARPDVFANPGPGEVHRVAARGVESVRSALGRARDLPAPGTLAESWWLDRDHDRLLAELAGLEQRASLIESLTATHDSIYGGAGEVSVEEALSRLSTAPTAGQDPLGGWANALRAELEGAGDAALARQARELVGLDWAARLSNLQPIDAQPLRTYLGQLPPRVLQGLSGHPAAGPALRRLGAGG